MQDLAADQELTDVLFHKIAHYVYEHARINLTENKRELVRARLGKVIRQRGFAGYRAYYEYMAADTTGEAVQEVMNAISTNLTSFFRENQHFEFISRQLLPELIKEKEAGRNQRLRVWSAGCSSGEEPYTLAMVLHSGLGQRRGWDLRILATDIDTEMVAHGERGVYPADRLRTVPPPMLRTYFLRGDGKQQGYYRAKPVLRELIRFRKLNLMGSWPFKGGFDLIFCRNVMIYFDQPTQEFLVNRFYEMLAPRGHLFIGHSEGLTGVRHQFKYVQPTIYQKPV